MLNTQDERSKTLNSKDPIVIENERYEEIVEHYKNAHAESETWFRENYEDDFIRDLANYLSISTDTLKPWDDANDYFLPSTNINVEVYTARMMETIRGGRDFLTIYPRGKSDFNKSKLIKLLLRYMFEIPMKGYKPLLNSIRNKNIFGTSIMSVPWVLDVRKKRISGTYIFDKSVGEDGDWIREIQEENNSEDVPAPKDFSCLNKKSLKAVLKSNKDYVVRDMFEEVVVKDSPDLQVLDLFNVKVDPNGGNDIQKHKYTIVETIETIDEIKCKVKQGKYDSDQVDKLIATLAKDDKGRPVPKVDERVENNAISLRDMTEGITNNTCKDGIKIWVCYGRHELDNDMLEEETIAVIANGEFLLSFDRTPFTLNGVSFRPLVVDRFIELSHRFYGLGQARILEQLNLLLNHLVNQILNHGDLMNSPPLIYPQEGQWQPEYNIFAPAQAWASDNSDGFKILQTPDVKASQIQMIQFVEGFIQKTLGISDFTLGSGSGSIVTNDTAHGLANVLRETNRRLDFYSQNTHESCLKEMFEMVLKECQLFMDSEEVYKITDEDPNLIAESFATVTNADIQGLYDIKIYANSLTASREYDQVKWQNLLQMMTQVQDPQTGMPVYDPKKMGDMVLEANGEPFPSLYHFTPDQQKAEQTGQMGMPQGDKGKNPKPAASAMTDEANKDQPLGAI